MTVEHCQRWVIPTAVAGAVLALVASPAYADGVPIPPHGHEADIEMPAQKAILVYDEGTRHEELVLSIQLLGQSPEAAWVIPVPSVPEVRVVSAAWFSLLSDLTQPEVVTRTVPFGGCSTLGVPGPGEVEVLSRQQVGVYDVAVLTSGGSGALLEWLNGHGYGFPGEGKAILDAYVDQGWVFVATRVMPGQSAPAEGDVQPLWLSFDSREPVYPMRLTGLVGEPVNVLLYILARHRMEIEGFTTEFAGLLTLEPPAGEETGLADLLSGEPWYVTKLRAWGYSPDSMTDDLYPRQAANDEPFRQTIIRRVASPVTLCWPCTGSVALLAGLALSGWRYRQRREQVRP